MKRRIPRFEFTCDVCGIVKSETTGDLPTGWIKKTYTPRVELDEFYGRSEDVCPNCATKPEQLELEI